MTLATSNDESVLIIKVITGDSKILSNLLKYEKYINFLLNRINILKCSIEFLGNHFLIFIKTVENFIEFVDIQLKKLEDFNKEEQEQNSKRIINFLVHRIYKKKTFPEDGILYKINLINEANKEELIYEKYQINKTLQLVQRINKGIEISQDDERKYYLKIKNYEALVSFGNYLYYNLFKFDKIEKDLEAL